MKKTVRVVHAFEERLDNEYDPNSQLRQIKIKL